MAVFLLVAHGTAGDVLPFARIGAELAGRGHDVTLISHAPFARHAPYGFAAIDTEERYRAAQAHTHELLNVRRSEDLRRYYDERGLFAEMAREVALLTERHRPGETVLVGRHTSALSVPVAADLLCAPAVWVAVAPVQVMVAPIAAVHARKGLASGIDAVRAGVGLPPVADWPGFLRMPVLGLWPGWFDAAGVRSRATLTGFVCGDEDGAAVTLPGRPILVTGGTGQMLHPRYYEVALTAAGLVDHPVVVVSPEPAEGFDWYRSLPFPSALPQCGAILHHGGIGTAARALLSGTPQVLLAHGADRPDVAARLARHDLARWLPADAWTAEAVADRLWAALTDTGYGTRTAAFTEPTSAAPARAADFLETRLNRGPSMP
ncbi:glycosyltransferase [Dactylosporangium sp. NPDC051541]|uniref:glycosyltransferase n=1 Tax=Dactylosporangium sp. NPDC051541 TaxID=3363977 RepID=UPI0037B0F2FD